MALTFSRRDVLRTGLLGAAGLSLSACAGIPTLPSDIALTRLIDVHAHLFNGADIPIRGFALSVLQLDRAIAALVTGLARTAFPARREIADLRGDLGLIDTQGAQASNEEILAAYFRAVARSGGAAPDAARPADRIVASDAEEAALRLEGLERLTTIMLPEEARSRTRAARVAPDPAMADRFAQAIFQADAAPVTAGNRLAALGTDPCAGGELSAGNLPAILRWITWLTRRRSFLLDRLHTVFGAGAIPQLLTPALVDYGFWVNDFGTTSFAEQIEVQALLSRRANAQGYAVHGFVSFDPWRHAWLKAQGQPEGALGWVRHAIGELGADGAVTRVGCGFVGVKLYPPMGFRAFGNAALPDAGFPPSLRDLARSQGLSAGALLDQGMAELFAWCTAQDVPVMAHCGASNFPSAAWADDPPGARTADPAFWRLALERWPNLRLNLAHAGGLVTQACADATRSAAWLDEVLALAADPRFPHVYADTGDMTELFAAGRGDAAREIIERLRAALARHPAAADRLLYGSDWIMQARINGFERYLSAMQKSLVPALAGVAGADFGGRFFLANAQGFLNLRDGSPTIRRLAPFYRAWDGLPALDRSVLDGFIA